MISVDEALSIVREEAQRIGNDERAYADTQIETIDIKNAYTSQVIDRVIAQDIYASMNVPQFDNSAMDGYVFDIDDIHYQDDSTQSDPIAIKGEASAGDGSHILETHTGMRIFTGAPIPQHANVVVPQEHCVYNPQTNTVVIEGAYKPVLNDHIRAKGLIFGEQENIASVGQVLTISLLTAIASAGVAQVLVYKKTRVALCITGDELVSLGSPLQYGQIYDSNSIYLAHLMRVYGCEVGETVFLRDDYETTAQWFEHNADNYDVIICSGGVSVGDKDYIRKIIEEKAYVYIQKVSMKPGKPFTFAKIGNVPIFALPGNPLSLCVCAHYFLLPFIHIIQHKQFEGHSFDFVPAPHDLVAESRTLFLFAACNEEKEVTILSEQSSAALNNMTQANGLLIIPAETTIKKGSEVIFFPFSP